MDLKDFYLKFIDLTDRVLPALPSAESSVCLHFFARTIAVGSETCRLSYSDLMQLTGRTVGTVKTAINGLIGKGIISIETKESPRSKRTYKFHYPSDIKKISGLQRDPMLLLKDFGGIYAYEGILNKLTQDDRELLEILRDSLSIEEIKKLRKMATDSLKAGENVEDKYNELIILTKFGPERLKRYEGG